MNRNGQSTCKAARRKALAARPEHEQARLRIRQAEIETQQKKAEYIPNVSLAVTYASAFHLGSGLPGNLIHCRGSGRLGGF